MFIILQKSSALLTFEMTKNKIYIAFSKTNIPFSTCCIL